ncbi:MAG: DNA alkylation repair protein [Bacteroidota bacterium]
MILFLRVLMKEKGNTIFQLPLPSDNTTMTLQETIKTFRENTHPQATQMAAYMRDQFPFLGIKKPERTALAKSFLNDLPKSTEEIREICFTLWEQPEREFQYLALDVLRKSSKKTLNTDNLEWLEELVLTKSWWDSVDPLSSPIIGDILFKHPEYAQTITKRWISSANFWLNRMAIIFQLRYKENTNATMLFDYCRQKSGSDEFFIQKGIGWALREYSKTDAEAVRKFVSETELTPLSKREGLKWLERRASKA